MRAIGWAAGAWLLWAIPRCRRGRVDHHRKVAVIVPARNEEQRLPSTLRSLAAQDPPPAEVVVVDDDSGDATVAVAERAGARVVSAPPLPPGWTGKAWACSIGVEATTEPVLVFLDADTELEHGGLAAIVDEHRHRGGLVSVQPFHHTERAYEALSAFFNVVSMMAVEAFTPLGGRVTPTGAFGPCLVCSRHDYLVAGGHRSVRGEVLEDLALARRFDEAGSNVTCLGGRGAVNFRMYGGGIVELVEGWTKNFASGARSTRPLTFLLVSAWLAGCSKAALDLAVGAARNPRAPGRALAWYSAYAAQLGWMLRRIGRFPRGTAAAYPLPLAAFVVIFARSLALTYGRGQVRWRGRDVKV